MTTPVSNIPVSIDYTSRDYYALRDALIQRVQERTGGKWAGNDPSDFGVALVETFAYMGDIINYYIDRVANESYLGTATQRQSVLNLASMLGYTAGGYTSATVNVTLTNSLNVGYRGQIGASQLTGGTARLVIPNDNVDADPSIGIGDKVNVSGLSRSEYNGTFTITSKDLGTNEIEYVPLNLTVSAVGDGTNVVFTTSVPHGILKDEIVTTSGFSTGTYNLANKTVTAVTATTFTVLASLSGSVSGGTVKYADIASNNAITGFVHNIGYVTVPEGTQLLAEISNNGVVSQVIFTTKAQAVIPFINDDGTAGNQTVLAKHGIDVSTLGQNQASLAFDVDINGELIGYSTGEADQVMALIESQVDISTLVIYVENGNTFDTWTATQYLEDELPTAKKYKVEIDSEFNIFINFGDGVAGAIPTKGSRIKASYYRGAGLTGNIPARAISQIYDVPGATSAIKTLIMSKVTPSNESAASGGDDPESMASIRNTAPKTLRALTRAVTLEDFSNLALSIPQVGKANAVAALPTSVVVYISPEKSVNNFEITPGVEEFTELGVTSYRATPELVLLKNDVSTFLADKVQIGTTVTVLDPEYSFAKLTVQYTKGPNFSQAAVERAIKDEILNTYNYQNLDFQATISPQMIEDSLRKVNGVKSAYLSALYLDETGVTRSTLTGSVNEIFVFLESNITLVTASSEARLSALTSSITLSPTFNQDVYSYSCSTSATTITLTPTQGATGQNITIANQSVGSGVGKVITLNVGVNTIPVTVTAADGVTAKTYVVTVTKS
jgi:hypothetical protein